MKKIDTIVFDLGGVLIDWNPRYLYRKIFKTEEEISWFMDNICTPEWNDHQDAGRSFQEATEELVALHPQHEHPIRAWYDRWQETIGGAIPGTVTVLDEIKKQNMHKLYALTNWSAETFPWALDNFEFLHWFEGIVVSGREKTRKPFADIYNILIKRHTIEPTYAVFIDDNVKNIAAAQALGFHAIRFQSPEQLRADLREIGILR